MHVKKICSEEVKYFEAALYCWCIVYFCSAKYLGFALKNEKLKLFEETSYDMNLYNIDFKPVYDLSVLKTPCMYL